jgi:nucleotide-binding universal stress UspA family protein
MLVVKPSDHSGDAGVDGFLSAVISCDSHRHWQQLGSLLALVQPALGSRVQLVHAVEGPMDNAGADADAVSYGQVQEVVQEQLRRGMRLKARQLFTHVDEIVVTVAPGVPQEMVLRIAREETTDLIVVGVRRSGKVGRWISGSTTEALLRLAPCCVLTVPESVGSKQADGDRR